MAQFPAEGWLSNDDVAKALQHDRLGNMLTPLTWIAGLLQYGGISESGEKKTGEESKKSNQVMDSKRKCFTLCKVFVALETPCGSLDEGIEMLLLTSDVPGEVVHW